MLRRALAKLLRNSAEKQTPAFTGSCPIREHTGDDAYVGRCEYATYDGVCPRHGRLDMYLTNDDREVDPRDRSFGALEEPHA